MTNLVSDDKSTKNSLKNTKIRKCHEKVKNPTKSDETLSIWSQTGQGNLFRGVPDPKKIQKMSNFGIWAHFGPFWSKNEVRLGLSRTSVYETTESDAPGALG